MQTLGGFYHIWTKKHFDLDTLFDAFVLISVGELNTNKNNKAVIEPLGYRTGMKELFWLVNVFVMSVLREGLSRSFMEAMVSDFTCLVIDIRRDLIEDSQGGFLCKQNSNGEYAFAINKLLI